MVRHSGVWALVALGALVVVVVVGVQGGSLAIPAVEIAISAGMGAVTVGPQQAHTRVVHLAR